MVATSTVTAYKSGPRILINIPSKIVQAEGIYPGDLLSIGVSNTHVKAKRKKRLFGKDVTIPPTPIVVEEPVPTPFDLEIPTTTDFNPEAPKTRDSSLESPKIDKINPETRVGIMMLLRNKPAVEVFKQVEEETELTQADILEDEKLNRAVEENKAKFSISQSNPFTSEGQT